MPYFLFVTPGNLLCWRFLGQRSTLRLILLSTLSLSLFIALLSVIFHPVGPLLGLAPLRRGRRHLRRRRGRLLPGLRRLHRRTWPNLPQLRIRIQIVAPNPDNPPFSLTAQHPIRHDDRDVGRNRLLPVGPLPFGANKMCGIQSDSFNQLPADPLHRLAQTLPERGRHHTRRDHNAVQICHLMGPDAQPLAQPSTGTRPQHKLKYVLGVQGQAGNLGAARLKRAGDVPDFAAVAVHGEGAALRRRQRQRIPFEDHRRLGRVAAAEDRRAGRVCAEGLIDLGLQLGERVGGRGFGSVVARHSHIDYRAAGYVGWEEYRGEFDLAGRQRLSARRGLEMMG